MKRKAKTPPPAQETLGAELDETLRAYVAAGCPAEEGDDDDLPEMPEMEEGMTVAWFFKRAPKARPAAATVVPAAPPPAARKAGKRTKPEP